MCKLLKKVVFVVDIFHRNKKSLVITQRKIPCRVKYHKRILNLYQFHNRNMNNCYNDTKEVPWLTQPATANSLAKKN